MAVLVVATFMIGNTANMSTAYGCNNVSGTNQTNSTSVVKNGSGNFTTRPSASTSSSQILDVAVVPPRIGFTPPTVIGVNSQTNRIYP